MEGRGYGTETQSIDSSGCGDGGDCGKLGRDGVEVMALVEWGKLDRDDVYGVGWRFFSAQRRDGRVNVLEETKGKLVIRREGGVPGATGFLTYAVDGID